MRDGAVYEIREEMHHARRHDKAGDDRKRDEEPLLEAGSGQRGHKTEGKGDR
jgi:hypothetical protein